MMDSMKQWFGLIRHRVYFLVGLGVVVTLLAGSVSFFVFNTLDVVTLISRVERTHTVNVFRARSSLHQYGVLGTSPPKVTHIAAAHGT